MLKNDDIKDLIDKSGNDFHLEIADQLESLGWTLNISPYYNDAATDKAREIDIIATRTFDVANDIGTDQDSFKVNLFIECKYVKDNIVVWRRPKDLSKASALVEKIDLLREMVKNRMSIAHHYLDDLNVVKLATKAGKTDVFFDGMNGCLNALIFYREHGDSRQQHSVNYPILVINNWNKVHEKNSTAEKGYVQLEGPTQLEVDYSFRNKEAKPITEYFLVDVIAKSDLENFLSVLNDYDIKSYTKGLKGLLFNRWQTLQRQISDRRNNNLDSW